MAYHIVNSRGSVLSIIQAESLDDFTLPISLFGKGKLEYGFGLLENQVYMLENFANSTPPSNPIEGQFWYDTSSNKMSIWETGSPGGWVQLLDAGNGTSVFDGDIIISSTGSLTLNYTPTNPTDAITVQYADDNYVNKTGDTMSGDLDMDGSNILDVAAIVYNSSDKIRVGAKTEIVNGILHVSDSDAFIGLDDIVANDGLPYKRITCNDGGGNLNIRCGDYDDGLGTALYSVTGDSAVDISMASEGLPGYIRLRTANAGVAGDPVTWNTDVYITDGEITIVTGDLVLNSDPTDPNHAVRKGYADSAYAAFTSGTRMVFYQASAPTGWTTVSFGTEYMMRVVNSGGANGGTDNPILNDKVSSHSHTVSGTTGAVGNHAHSGTTANNGNHSHQYNMPVSPTAKIAGSGSTCFQSASTVNTTTNGDHNHSFSTSATGSHTHTFNAGSSTPVAPNVGDWTPRYLDVIVGEKS